MPFMVNLEHEFVDRNRGIKVPLKSSAHFYVKLFPPPLSLSRTTIFFDQILTPAVRLFYNMN